LQGDPEDPSSNTPYKSDSVAPDSNPPRRAAQSPTAIVTFVLLAAAALAGDLLSKHYAFDSLLGDPILNGQLGMLRNIRGDLLTQHDALRVFQRDVGLGVKLTLSTNPGIIFGLPLPRWCVAAATVITVALVLFFFASMEAGARLVHVALSLILAGALGNLYDRLFSSVAVAGFTDPIRYEVRDFLDFSEWYYPWIFNVADAWLVIGLALLLIHWYRTPHSAKTTTPQ
jgi:signal peptidase II